MQVLGQTTEYDALQWSAAVKQHYAEERSLIAAAAEQATRASAERANIGQWLSGLVLREGKVVIRSRPAPCIDICKDGQPRALLRSVSRIGSRADYAGCMSLHCTALPACRACVRTTRK